jgi:hypothetical protein
MKKSPDSDQTTYTLVDTSKGITILSCSSHEMAQGFINNRQANGRDVSMLQIREETVGQLSATLKSIEAHRIIDRAIANEKAS